MRNLLSTAALALLAAVVTFGTFGSRAHAAAPPPTKVGYVDLQRTLNETKSGKAARGRLESDKKKKQAQLDQQQEELKKYKDDLDKQAAVLKPEVLRQKQRDLQERVVALQETFMQLQQELARREAQLTQDIFKAAAKVIEDIARRDAYTIMLERNESAVLWADKAYDITDEVNRRMDAGEAGK
ncbi:MAG: OmpH family outer membrane protein [Myxococcales bacterium]|nr:OmpH family outer membrane protein [Myxococcales bacterium]